MSRALGPSAVSEWASRWKPYFNPSLKQWLVVRTVRIAGCVERETYGLNGLAERHETESRAKRRCRMLNGDCEA